MHLFRNCTYTSIHHSPLLDGFNPPIRQVATKMEEHAMAEPQKLGGNQRPQGAPTPAANGRPETPQLGR